MVVLVAVACAATAVWVVTSPPPAALRLSGVLPSASATDRPLARAVWSVLSRWPPPHLPGRGRREVERLGAAVVELCDGLAAELAAGRPTGTALVNAADALPGLPGIDQVVAAVRRGDDVAGALDQASGARGCEALRLLAGCWRVGVERGGMLATVVEGLAEALRDERSHREEVAVQLAGPRATARLLAGLPVVGILMAVALGARPLAFLFGSAPGLLCLVLGVALDGLGLWWTARLATAAEGGR